MNNYSILEFIVCTLVTILGVLFHYMLYQIARQDVLDKKYNTIAENPIWMFVAFPGGLFYIGPVGMYLTGLHLLYP